MKQRLKTLTKWLTDNGVDLAFVQTKENVFYLSDFYSEPHERLLGMFIFPDQEPLLITPKMEVSQAKASGWLYEVIGYSDTEDPWELLGNYIKKHSKVIKTMAIEEESISYVRAKHLIRLFPDVKLSSVDDKLNELRMIKDEEELSILKQAASLADFGVEVGVNAIERGKTEMDVLATIEYELKRKGISEMSFSTMVLTGMKTADPHGNPGLTQMSEGDFILFDLGVVLDGYCSDITRTVALKRVSDEQKNIYETVLHAQQEALAICQVGKRIGDIDKVAREIITNAGYGEYFPHRIGHGLGINVHEFPSLNENNNDSFKKGFVFTVEPGIYVPNVGGVRIEDDVVITENGYECLTTFPKDLLIIK